MSWKAYFQLARPANLVTAVADILAGVSVAGLLLTDAPWGWLVVSTIGLYGGGVVFNDVFDADLDRLERPERPIPSGRVSVQQATALGVLLLVLGVVAAARVSLISAYIAGAVAALALIYDRYGKHHTWLGPLNMGLCRSGNLLLGISISATALSDFWGLAIIPLIFISDVTLTSQGEVHGRNRQQLRWALLLDLLVVLVFVGIHLTTRFSLTPAAVFLGIWLWMNSAAKWSALRQNEPALIQRAVKMGVLSLIPLNAALTAGFSSWTAGLLVLALLPLSIGLSRLFAIT